MTNKETKSVFELLRIRYDSYDFSLQHPYFEVSESRVGLYSTLKKAEQLIKECIAIDEEYGDDLFGFLIYEYEIDTDCWIKSSRNYLSDGSLWDECLVSDNDNEDDIDGLGRLQGHPVEKLRFHPGDLVEELDGETVVFGIVCSTPPSPEDVIKYPLPNPERCDDCYLVLSVYDDENDTFFYYHSHPLPTDLFPVRLPMSDEIRKNLETRYKKYKKYKHGE